MSAETILSVTELVKHFDISGGLLDQLSFSGGKFHRKRTVVKAVNGVSFDVKKGETLSVVGESGCGKSTLARAIIGLYPPNSGSVTYRGARVDNLSHHDMLPFRAKMQMVFQDPYASLNPRIRVKQILDEPLKFHFPNLSVAQRAERVAEVMELVGVRPRWASHYPHEFSGGQRQRISIARALMVDPDFIVADEPISALDVSIQAQILNLLMDAQEKRDLTYMFITHDLSVVRHISARVAVMYLGTVCELSPVEELFTNPRHPYTRVLLAAIPKLGAPHRRSAHIKGEVPTPINLPPGCVFNTRCEFATDLCRVESPKLENYDGVMVACHGVEEGRI